MAKSLLNNLLGRFGINLEKSVTEYMSTKTFEEKSIMHKITSYDYIGEDKVLVRYVPKIDKEIVDSHNLDLIKIVNKFNDNEIQTLNVTSIPISAAVTSYGIIHISKLKLDILSKGGNIYYSDTDSIVTYQELPHSMINDKDIGKLKLPNF